MMFIVYFNRIQGFVLFVGVEYQVDVECCVQTGHYPHHTSANIDLFLHAHNDNEVRISADVYISQWCDEKADRMVKHL